jgi:hypothetical protein
MVTCGCKSYICHYSVLETAPYYQAHLERVNEDLELRTSYHDGCFVTGVHYIARQAAWIRKGGTEYTAHRLQAISIDVAKTWHRQDQMDQEMQFWNLRCHTLRKHKGLRQKDLQEQMLLISEHWLNYYSLEVSRLGNLASDLLTICIALHPKMKSVAYRVGEETVILWQGVHVLTANTIADSSSEHSERPTQKQMHRSRFISGKEDD